MRASRRATRRSSHEQPGRSQGEYRSICSPGETRGSASVPTHIPGLHPGYESQASEGPLGGPVRSTVGVNMNAAADAGDAMLPWTRSRRIALREFCVGDQAAILAMHRDARLRALLVDDYPLDDPGVAQVFLDRMATIYRRHEGLGIWHASLIGSPPVFAGWFNLMPMAEQPG